MANFYAAQQVGVADGTKNPPDKADGRVVGAKLSTIAASKVAGQAWAQADKVFLGRLNPGESIRQILATTDTSLGTTTLSIGTLAAPAKYVNGATLTALNAPTTIGPLAAALAAGPPSVGEDLWMTFGVGGVAGATVLNLDIRIASVK